MGLLGLRKFIDSSGCTRLLPVPLSDAEAEEEVNRRLRAEGFFELSEEGTNVANRSTGALKTDIDEVDESIGSVHGGASQRRGYCLTSSSHVSSSADVDAAACTAGTTTTEADHVLVDMNCIVHSCFHRQNTENKSKKQLIHEVLERLRVLVTEVVMPRRSLSICFDGPAPIAKLQTQRLRRRKVSLLDTGGTQQLNTLSITAGSLFMIELENAIASQFKLNHGRGFLRRACPVYLYGTTVMGEGEAKISRALAFLAYGSTDGSAEIADGAVADHHGGRHLPSRRDRQPKHTNLSHQGSKVSHNPTAWGDADNGGDHSSHTTSSSGWHPAVPLSHFRPNDTVVVIGNDIDLVVTCLGATAFHNFSIVSPSSLQLIRVSDIIYRWLKATSATRGDSPFTPSQLPSIRIDFIFLFLLNGGDHYTGAGEVAMSLWSRYRSVRAAYPHSSLVTPNLDTIDIDFLADVLQVSEYTGSSSVEIGMSLLQSALWSLYTVVTGVCPDYHYVPEPAAPQLCHLRAAAAHCQRTGKRVQLPVVQRNSQPLTPLETYVALMPTEATLPKSVATGLHSKLAHQSILKTLETSNDAATIAQAAKDAVEVSTPWLTKSEQYLRLFTSPVQLNVNPSRRRLSRHEQHRLIKVHGRVPVEDPVPVVKPITMLEQVQYIHVSYPPRTNYLDFFSPFDAVAPAPHSNAVKNGGAAVADVGASAHGGRVTYVCGRAISSRPSLYTTAVATSSTAQRSGNEAHHSVAEADVPINHRRVSLHGEELTAERQRREGQSATAKLQRTLHLATNILERGQHISKPQQRRIQRRLHRLQEAGDTELRAQLAKEDRRYVLRGGKQNSLVFEEELRQFLGDTASPEDVKALLRTSEEGKKGSLPAKASDLPVRDSPPKKKSMKAAQHSVRAKPSYHPNAVQKDAGAPAGEKARRIRGSSNAGRNGDHLPSSSVALHTKRRRDDILPASTHAAAQPKDDAGRPRRHHDEDSRERPHVSSPRCASLPPPKKKTRSA